MNELTEIEIAACEQFPNKAEKQYRQLYVLAHCGKTDVPQYIAKWPELFEQEYMQGATPQTAQDTARSLIDAYRKGLDFRAIDKEAIKQEIRDNLERGVRNGKG